MISASELSSRIRSAQHRLHERLVSLDVSTVGLSDYNQRYLKAKISDIATALHTYGCILHQALKNSALPIEKLTVVDYGGGSGVLSLLAKELGVGTVIYIDIYEISRQDAAKLSAKIGLPLDHTLSGDVDALVEYARQHSLVVNAVVSFDVLEHIYDVPAHFKKLNSLSTQPFRAVYASGANIKNRWYVKGVTQQHIAAEYRDREKQWGQKERDTLRAYFDLRKEIISTHAPQLTEKEIDQLARETRGLMKGDIERCVDEFRASGKHSYIPDHPTNTCDPTNGNWCEHLMDQNWLLARVQEAGFQVQILPGNYYVSGTLTKKAKKLAVNTVISILGSASLPVSPYFLLCADKVPR
jgi:2-polyprenyl-3-methyl-5-hydroxy-6-metoxy-1,4-benzoquinol methylase